MTDAVEQAVELGLILTANPRGTENRREDTRVLIGTNAKQRGGRSGIYIDGRKGEGVWGCCDYRRKVNKDETLQEGGPEVEWEKARKSRPL